MGKPQWRLTVKAVFFFFLMLHPLHTVRLCALHTHFGGSKILCPPGLRNHENLLLFFSSCRISTEMARFDFFFFFA